MKMKARRYVGLFLWDLMKCRAALCRTGTIFLSVFR